MAILAVVFMGVVGLVGILIATLVGYLLHRWLGAAGAWLATIVLLAGVGFMLYVIRDGFVGKASQSSESQIIAQWCACALGIPAVLGVLSAVWMLKLATTK